MRRRIDLQKNPTWFVVVAAALRNRQGRWLMHRRPAGSHHGGLWEFPGGKVESGENPTLALIREIREELGIELSGEDLEPAIFADREAAADGREIVILLYTCDTWTGTPQALEGGAIDWVNEQEMRELAMPPLDRKLVDMLLSRLAV